MVDPGAFLLVQAQTSLQVQFMYDLASGQVVFINAAYEWVLGGQCDQVNEELPKLLARLHPDDRARLATCWARWTRNELHEEVVFRLRVTDHPDQWLQLTPSYQSAPDGPGWVGGQLRDISASRRYKANADHFNARKNTILEILSLDLSDVLVLSQSLRHEAEDAAAHYIWGRLLEGLRRLETLGQQGTKLVRAFVDEEIQTSVAIDLHMERLDLGEQLRFTLQDCLRNQALAAHTLRLQLPPYPVPVSLDVNKFLQVVTNFLSNFLKFTPDGGSLVIELVVARGIAHLTFADNGIGIPEALLPKLFERFTPARRQGLRGEPTLGVGLSICKLIVELHQGTIDVRSREGEGTTFIVTLPVLPT